MSLSFLVPAFLAGLLALAVPVVIHLSRRQTRTAVRFPSLMFLRRIPHQTESRRRIHRWPLLLLRALAVLLLVLAFARPFVDRGEDTAALARGGDREVVVLLDRSFSMGVGDRWERALQEGTRIIDGLSGNDRGTVIVFDANAEAITESTNDRSLLRTALRNIEPGPGTTRYAPALRYAGRILASSPLPRHELVIISDFQRGGWDSDGGETSTLRLPAGTVVTPIAVADTAPYANVTVAGAEFSRTTAEGRDRVTIVGRLTGTGPRETPVPIVLEVDGRVIETRMASFDAGVATVAFSPLTLPELGSVRATLRVEEDALAADDQLHFVLSADQRVGVLVVNGASAASPGSFYLERALGIGDAPGFRPTIRHATELRAADLVGNPVVILNQASLPAGEVGARLQHHVEQGGGLVLILGDNAPGEWTEVLPTIPPAIDRSSGGGTAIGFVDTGHPVFESFAGPRTGDFGATRVYKYRPLPNGSFPRVLARYGDGAIAFAEQRVGEGRVMVLSTTLDGNWNDLSLQPVFLPFLHQVVKYAAGYAPPRNWQIVGDPFDPGSTQFSEGDFSIALSPSGRQIAVERNVPFQLNEPGFYELRGSDGSARALPLAVNVDPAEADLTRFDPEEMRAALMAATGQAPLAGETGLTLQERERQQNGWWYLIIAAFLLLAAETLFSNRAGQAGHMGWRPLNRRIDKKKNNPKLAI